VSFWVAVGVLAVAYFVLLVMWFVLQVITAPIVTEESELFSASNRTALRFDAAQTGYLDD
jgi:hypothetical protein